MKHVLNMLIAAALAGPVAAQEVSSAEANDSFGPVAAADVTLGEFQWVKRPVVVFADTDADPRFQEQMDLLLARTEELIARDVVVIVDTDPTDPSDIRTQLRPRGFQLTLIGKDGGVKLRKPFPWSVREISRTIDKMPMRQREIRERATN